MSRPAQPKSLLEAVQYFSDPQVALAFVAAIRWPDGVECPHCASNDVGFLKTRRIWKCRECHKQFSAKVGSVLEDSPIPLEKWMPAFWMIVNCKNGISSYELARALKVTQKTAWFMLSRLRLAMQAEDGGKLDGHVEIDETFIGAKARNMHAWKRRAVLQGRKGGLFGKVAVLGMLKRSSETGKSQVRMQVVPKVKRGHLVPHIEKHVAVENTTVYTDALPSYDTLYQGDYEHKVIDHAKSYAEGNVHTNGMENFWALLKRSLHGTYVSVEPFHLFRYLDEQAFRFNHRATDDLGRFLVALKGLFGRRLTYTALTGSELPQT